MQWTNLGGRATAATIAIVFICVANVAFDAVSFGFAARADEGTATALFTVSILLLAGLVVCGIVFLTWLHAAAKNLRAIAPDATYQFSPGAVVGWWFVPIANWFRPFRAVKEIWTRSAELSPDGVAPSTNLLEWWWGAWLLSGFVGRIAGRIEDPHASSIAGMLSTAFTIFAGVALVQIMRAVTGWQSAADEARKRDPSLRQALQHTTDAPR